MTQLGHVKDLATAFKLILDNPKAKSQIYNVSGERCMPNSLIHALYPMLLLCLRTAHAIASH